jgi:hypothetical protein
MHAWKDYYLSDLSREGVKFCVVSRTYRYLLYTRENGKKENTDLELIQPVVVALF